MALANSGKMMNENAPAPIRKDATPPQRLQLVRSECMQVAGAAQCPQDVEVPERDGDQGCGLDQPPARGQQREASIDWHEDHVKSNDQDDIKREHGEIT